MTGAVATAHIWRDPCPDGGRDHCHNAGCCGRTGGRVGGQPGPGGGQVALACGVSCGPEKSWKYMGRTPCRAWCARTRNTTRQRRRGPARGRLRDAGAAGNRSSGGSLGSRGLVSRCGRPSDRPPTASGPCNDRPGEQSAGTGKGTRSRSAPTEQSDGKRTRLVSRSAPKDQSAGSRTRHSGARRTGGSNSSGERVHRRRKRSAPAEQSGGSGRRRCPRRRRLSNRLPTWRTGEAPPTQAWRGLRHARTLLRVP